MFAARRWSLAGYAGDGKTTFMMRMARPLLVIDGDGRITDSVDVNETDVYKLGDKATDSTDVRRIQTLLERDMPSSQIGTIGVDSITSIIGPAINKALANNAEGAVRNKSSGFMEKATAMRLLQDAVVRWGTDILFIWHYEANMFDGKPGERATLPPTEQKRLLRSLNAQLEVARKGELRGIRVAWVREGLAGLELWDHSGCWENMPERLDVALCGFAGGRGQALEWAVQRGKYADAAAAADAYEKLKAERQIGNAQDMWNAWGEHILVSEASKV